MVDALLRGCDLLDSANCLFPFPSNHFTESAATGSPQAVALGGTGLRVNINPLATPRNSAGKPVDPSEWNRNDGFSPGALIATYVPALSLEKTYGLPATDIGLANLALSQNANSPILLLEVPQAPEVAPRRALAWAEIDANAGLLAPVGVPVDTPSPPVPLPLPETIERPGPSQAALLIRPGKNLAEGRRYVVVLRKLKSADDTSIAAQAGFATCRDKTAATTPPVMQRCAALERDVFPVLAAAGIARDQNLFLAWDFTVASTANQVGRLRQMRNDAFKTLADNPATNDCTRYSEGAPCRAPEFTVDQVTQNPQTGIARRIEGTLRVPSYLIPGDASPLEDPAVTAVLQQACAILPPDAPDEFREGCETLRDGAGIAQGLSAPPNRLNYTPGVNPNDPRGSVYGDGLPDRNGDMTTRYICQIPARATPDAPARAGVYGHGLLDGRSAVTYDGVPELSREHNYMFCAVDFFGFATGDLGNVLASLVDLSNFPVIPDASQQGFVNFMFLARLIRDARGFASDPAFQDTGTQRPLFDRSDVFYDGNSQGGILGGVVMAASRDIQRGVLGSLGMNYSTLLTRSTDFDVYATPLYLSYTDSLDRQVLFSMIQMLWDRSENNGYAAHLSDNRAFGGAPKTVKLDPQFGDHQVTMWSADVMARTMNIPYDNQQTQRVAVINEQTKRHPDVTPYFGMTALNYSDTAATSGSAEIVWDDRQTKIPPFNNTPPRAGRDPHDDSAKKASGRCQKAHFLRTGGKLIDATDIELGNAPCPPVPPAAAASAVATRLDLTTPAGILSRLGRGLNSMFIALAAGNLPGAGSALQSTLGGFADDALRLAAQQAGIAAGMFLPPPGPNTAPNTPPPQALLAGVSRGALRVPVGVPLAGYLRPPVGGEYIPGAEALAGGDPTVFLKEIADFIPSLDDNGQPLAPIPDELRKLHSPYATFSPPSRGYYDSLIAKAVALYDGHDYVVLVKTDFIGMIDEVVQAVAAEVKRRRPQVDLSQGLIMSATHTHDGPGAIGNHSLRYFWLAIDAYQPELFERLVPQLADVVVAALDDLKPARFGYAMGQENHRNALDNSRQPLNSFRRSRAAGYDIECSDDGLCDDGLRERIGVLRVDRLNAGTAQPLALVMNYAAHGIAFDVENQYFSGDVLAAAEREVEQSFARPMLAMLVQNTGGDVSPRADGGPTLQRIERFGKWLAPQVRAIYDGVGNFDGAPDLRAVSQRVILSRERLGYTAQEFPYEWGAAQCNNDAGVPFTGPNIEQKNPFCLAAPPPDPIDLADNGVAENGAFVPQDTRVSAVKIGTALLLAQPGEPLSEYGVRVLKAARDVGFAPQDTFIWGYAQDHVGYIMAPEKSDWDQGGTEGTTTFWGWKQGQRLIDVNRELARALRNNAASPADEFQVNYFYDAVYKQVPRYPAVPSLRPGRIVTQPINIARFEQTEFAWEGGDPVVDTPSVALQRQVNGQWVAATRANGEAVTGLYEMHLKYRLVTGAHLWTLEFEAPHNWPAGSYRFSVTGVANQGVDAPYVIASNAFVLAPARTLQISTPVRDGANVSVTLAYTPQPQNYRLIDADVPVTSPAPVRQGMVVFSNGNADQTVVDTQPDLIRQGSNILAVYRATIAGNASVAGVDAFENTTPGAPPAVTGISGYGTGVLGAFGSFFSRANGVIFALAQGDFTGAGAQAQVAFTALVADIRSVVDGNEASVMALLTHAFANASDPPRLIAGAGADLGAVLGLDTDPASAAQRAVAAERRAEAVVLTGAQVTAWVVPAAQGVPYPYPSGAVTTGEFLPEEFQKNGGQHAHNGQMLYPLPGSPMGKPVNRIAAYKWSGSAFVEIPVQVDQKFPFFLANSASDFSVYSGTDEELTYEWDLERWQNTDSPANLCNAGYVKGMADPVTGLDADDEIVFMAQDAGAQMAPPNAAKPADLSSDPADALQEIVLNDALNPQYRSFVYLGIKRAGSAPAFASAETYVRYRRDANADQWIDRSFFADNDPEKLGSSNTGYGPNRSGMVCANGQLATARASTDRFPRDGVTVTTDAYRWYASGRWMIRELQVAKPGKPGVYGPDLIDRWKGRAFQQSPDSNISVVGFEDEQVNWEANANLLGERRGPVRAIREIWGADSGTNVTKTETFYRDSISYRYHVRVHPIPPDGLYNSWDYNRSAMLRAPGESVPEGRYYTVLRPQGVPIDGVNDDIGQVDGTVPIPGLGCISLDASGFVPPAPDGRCPSFFDSADPAFNLPLATHNWEQVSGKGDAGSLVYTFELTGATSLTNPLVVPYYRDDACLDDGTGDDPVQRPFPGESYAWNNGAVTKAYDARAGRALDYSGAMRADCAQRQGAYGAHGAHYFVTHDTDNGFLLGKPINEIDGRQWQFAVPTAAPQNLGERYSNIVRVPLTAVVRAVAP